MTSSDPVPVSTAYFCSPAFWKRMGTLAAEHGHGDHPYAIIGSAENLHRYALECIRCNQMITGMVVSPPDGKVKEPSPRTAHVGAA